MLARRALEKAMDTVAGTIERLVNDQKPSVLLIGLVPPAPELTGVRS